MGERTLFLNKIAVGNTGAEDNIKSNAEKYAWELENAGEDVTIQAMQDKFLRGYDPSKRVMQFESHSTAISIAIEKQLENKGIELEECIGYYVDMVREYLGDHMYREDTLRNMIMDDRYSTGKLGPLRWKLDLKYINIAILRVMDEKKRNWPKVVYECDHGLAK